jgi:hypothetical protein
LGFIKVDAVLLLVGMVLDWIILELHAVWKIYLKIQLPQEITFSQTSQITGCELLLSQIQRLQDVFMCFLQSYI